MVSNRGRMVPVQVCLKEFILLSAWMVIARGGKKINKVTFKGAENKEIESWTVSKLRPCYEMFGKR